MADPQKTDEVAFAEGDEVLLRAKVYRANGGQAFIKFLSMEGIYSIRVPISELSHSHVKENPHG